MSQRDPRELDNCTDCGRRRSDHKDVGHPFIESLSDHLRCGGCGFEMAQSGPDYKKCRVCGWERSDPFLRL